MKRKGITPVIAVVLLLLITVGAVASAWGLYQKLANRGQSNLQAFNKQQKASSTNLPIRTAYKSSSGSIMISYENTGQRAVNMSKEITLYASPPGEQGYLPYNVLQNSYGGVVAGSNTCTQGMISPGEARTCNTGLAWPSVGNTMGIRLNYDGVSGVYWDYKCDPQTAATSTC